MFHRVEAFSSQKSIFLLSLFSFLLLLLSLGLQDSLNTHFLQGLLGLQLCILKQMDSTCVWPWGEGDNNWPNGKGVKHPIVEE